MNIKTYELTKEKFSMNALGFLLQLKILTTGLNKFFIFIFSLYQYVLKGQCHEIFCNHIFPPSAYSGSIRDVLWPFRFLCFFKELLDFKNDSPVLRKPQSQPKYFALEKFIEHKSNVFV